MAIALDTLLAAIGGVHQKFLARLARLGLRTVRDLLYYFPTRYDDFSAVRPIAELEPGERVTVQGTVERISTRQSWRRRFAIVETEITDASGAIRAVWFNQPYVAQTLRRGAQFNFSGKVSANEDGELYLSNPTYEQTRINADNTQMYANGGDPRESALHPQPSASWKHTGRLVPIYPETHGLTSKGIRFLAYPILQHIAPLEEFIPEEILRAARLPNLNKALQDIHFPHELEDAAAAKRRFAFEGLFLLQLANFRARMALRRESAPVIAVAIERLKKLVGALPFPLTVSQKKSLWEILQDLAEPHPMNRLLQGDVGSGKTVIAALAAFLAAESGVQTAVMAPTEVLARQHYETFKKLAFITKVTKVKPPYHGGLTFVSIALLTASESRLTNPSKSDFDNVTDADETTLPKKRLKDAIARGEVAIAIGTHALLGSALRWRNLGLAVIDEQHRFGIKQRAALVRPPQIHANSARTNADAENDHLLFRDLTHKVRGIIFKVRNAIGQGLKENIYQNALAEELEKEGITFEREKMMGIFRPDFIIGDKIILEIKAAPFVGKIEERQIWSYLKGTQYKIALLVNFGGKELQVKRVGYDTARNPRESASLPHFLSMSATPIPRTLMLSVFGDLDLSTIIELPPGRMPVKTYIVPPEKRANAYEFIRAHVKKGRQAFVICPRIQPTTQMNADDVPMNADEKYSRASSSHSHISHRYSSPQIEVKTVEKEYERLSTKIFPDLRVAMLHGKMPARGGSSSGGKATKESVMRGFREGNTDILVSTSVVEVGVDVPNATIMMIEGADRFGLAQLYQLRGRVGRGAHESFCFLFTDSNSQSTAARLKAITKAKNGFELAEYDLKHRGPGEFLGEAQTGFPDAAMDALADPPLVSAAREAAKTMLRKDPALAAHDPLKQKLEEFERAIHRE